MSSAIVAKVLNDTVGTPEFKGLNTIFDEHLNKLDEILKENIEGIKEAVLPVSNLSNPVYAYDTDKDDAPFASIEQKGPYEPGTVESKKIRLDYEGIVKVVHLGRTTSTLHAANVLGREGVDGIYIYRISKGATFWLTVGSYNDEETENLIRGNGVLEIYGHTEFAPPLKYELID